MKRNPNPITGWAKVYLLERNKALPETTEFFNTTSKQRRQGRNSQKAWRSEVLQNPHNRSSTIKLVVFICGILILIPVVSFPGLIGAHTTRGILLLLQSNIGQVHF